MINPLFLPQNAKKRQKTVIEQIKQNRKQFKLIHQLDCIYQGQVNDSYQREGFGMQQTNQFNVYLGFWKANKPNGIGMIIYSEAGIIYGNFKENQLHGVTLIDNKKRLRVGIYENDEIIGVGYQYSYQQTKWKLCRFHKGVCIETISSEVLSLQNGIPSMFNLHQDILVLLSRYLNQQFFDIPNKNLIGRPYRSYTQMNVHKINNSYFFFGQIIDGKYWGLGTIYDIKNGYAIQSGYYEMGQMNGYGIKIIKEKNQIQIGLYNKGKKQGFFYQKRNHIQIIVEYQKNFIKGEHPELNRTKINNNQKIFNYQKNDFYSQKNRIKFEKYIELFKQGEKQVNKLNEHLKMNIAGKGKPPQGKPSKKGEKISSTKTLGKAQQSPRYLMPQSQVQKSTVQVIRQKLGDIDRIIKRSKAMVKQQKGQKTSPMKPKPVNLDIPQQENKKEVFIQDGSIEDQYFPIEKSSYASRSPRRGDLYSQNRRSRRLKPNYQNGASNQKTKDQTSLNPIKKRIFFNQKNESSNFKGHSNQKSGRQTSVKQKKRIFG